MLGAERQVTVTATEAYKDNQVKVTATVAYKDSKVSNYPQPLKTVPDMSNERESKATHSPLMERQ